MVRKDAPGLSSLERFIAGHHFNEAMIAFADDFGQEDAEPKKLGIESWYDCMHCPTAWVEDLPEPDEEQGTEKHYRDMNNEERLAAFDAMLAEEKRRCGENTSNLRASLVIGVRHFIHPFAYDSGREFMRRAAAACGAALDSDGVWAPCRGELWLREVLAQPEGGA
jgi:hypothetical protein